MCRRSASRVRACIRARVCTHRARTLRKRTVSLSRAVGVGIAFVGMRICPRVHRHTHVSGEAPFAKTILRKCATELSRSSPPAPLFASGDRESIAGAETVSRIPQDGGTASRRRLNARFIVIGAGLIRRDRCEYEIAVLAPRPCTRRRFCSERIYATRLLERSSSCRQRRRIA